MKICARVKKLRDGEGGDESFQPSLPVYLTNSPLVAAKNFGSSEAASKHSTDSYLQNSSTMQGFEKVWNHHFIF